MLDTATKRRIDTARDILVGKVPDPKSQVEQITIALIYKFMDDLDAESEELGGRRKFFAGGFARYGWAKLMSAGLGGHETLNLYAEAITRMPENPGIPPLFRDIFNNAYLPYRDPETLRAFLKVIDEFTYDHSERLGDAFEYLLSVLGSQGDAGQFRTPRHIIDFIVAVVDPKKDDVVLDPACGTAGFLISSYKHIHAANTTDGGDSTLTPDERGRLAANFKGYDISPDMVRLSLVNMYLHGFADPHIFEYDTLTSEDRWNEYADVILANPPFMSPKGGIRPHNRFSVRSKRSEVLFVDYMAEHLTPAGRAGIIVPEGIIFQSQTAYRQLRKMLVEEALVAVVSLPSGVFKPYSGVKTSILILDKSLAKKTDRIAFFKVENDGYDLGAQRREIAENDLPEIAQGVKAYLSGVQAGMNIAGNMDTQDMQDKEKSCSSALKNLIEQGSALTVAKEKIAANGEYNLSGERYRENLAHPSQFPIVPLGEVAEVIAGQSPPGKSYNDAGVGMPFYQGKTEFGQVFIGEPTKWTTDPRRLAEDGEILMSVRAPVGPVNFATQQICIGRGLAAIRPMEDQALAAYTFYILRSLESEIVGSTGAAFASINKGDIKKIEIPLPPLDVQREIVAEIEGYQRVIDGARAVIENYRPHIAVDPEWPMVAIGDIALEIKAGFASGKSRVDTEGVPHVRPMNVTENGQFIWEGMKRIRTEEYQGKEHYALVPGDILFNNTNSKELVGKTCLIKEEICGGFSNHMTRIRVVRERCDARFLAISLHAAWRRREFIERANKWIGQAGINLKSLGEFQIPLPSLDTQQALIAEIEAEQALANANEKLIERFEKKIQSTIARVWGEENTV